MVNFKLNIQGLSELMKSPGIQGQLDKAGQKVAKMAGPGFSAKGKTGRNIGFCNINPVTVWADKKNQRENTLIKALGSSGLRMSK